MRRRNNLSHDVRRARVRIGYNIWQVLKVHLSLRGRQRKKERSGPSLRVLARNDSKFCMNRRYYLLSTLYIGHDSDVIHRVNQSVCILTKKMWENSCSAISPLIIHDCPSCIFYMYYNDILSIFFVPLEIRQILKAYSVRLEYHVTPNYPTFFRRSKVMGFRCLRKFLQNGRSFYKQADTWLYP